MIEILSQVKDIADLNLWQFAIVSGLMICAYWAGDKKSQKRFDEFVSEHEELIDKEKLNAKIRNEKLKETYRLARNRINFD